MTHLRIYIAATATVAALAIGKGVLAQDDLDDLLADLEGDTPAAETAKTPEPETEPAETAAEEPAAESQTSEAEEAPAAAEETPAVAEEPVAEEPAAEEAPATEEAPAAEEAPAVAAEPAAEETPAVAEEPASSEPTDSLIAELISEIQTPPANESAAAPAAEPAQGVVQAAPAATEGQVAAKAVPQHKDAALLDELRTYEKLRREAMDVQAKREIDEARASMTSGKYLEAVRHYNIASNLLNDKPSSREFRDECFEGMAEGLYRAALEEDRTGRRDRAIKLVNKAVDMRHPKARRQLEAWQAEIDPSKKTIDAGKIAHRRNDADYKARRVRERQHLRRAQQLLAQREIDRALDECELVLVSDPYNQEAIRLRDSIQRKRDIILKQERAVTREAMIADVDEAWRPVYAVDARDIEETSGNTVKRGSGPDGERSIEQTIIKRMKEMVLPQISFKPPATIIDAVEYFRGASKDYDRPDIPIEKRGFNFVLKTPEAVRVKGEAAGADSDDFTDDGSEESAGGPIGVPVIPMLTASDITFYDALKLVCESVEYKFTVQGPIVMVMHRSMSTEELVSRSFPVLSTFIEKMSSASEDISTMGSSGFGSSSASRKKEEESDEDDEERWKKVFSLVGGVDWPEGSTIYHMKTLGKLFVNNTQDNLAKIENVLKDLGGSIKLVEIETRFIEVCQDDLNSLGFEWILNSNYSLGMNKHLGKALGIRGGEWGSGSTTSASSSSASSGSGFGTGSASTTGGGTTPGSGIVSPGSTTVASSTGWARSASNRDIGITATDGQNYSTGQRYLSTMSNHISGESKSTNDQFMKLNAFLGSADLSMILHMLAQRSDTDLLSAPKVLTRPGEEAVMKVVTEYIYPTDYDVQLQSSSSGSSGSSGSSQSAILAVVEPQSFTMREVGVILQVTPTLTDDGNVVDLELNTQVVDEPTWKNYGMKIPFTGNASSLQNFTGIGDILSGLSNVLTTLGAGLTADMKAKFSESAVNSATTALDNLTATGSDNMTYYDAPMEQPFFHVRSIDSKVSVYPGATIVMGGLITEARKAMDDKIPYLGDIPFLGRFFRSHSEQTTKRNLLIFVTTRIVDGRGRENQNSGFKIDDDQNEVKPAPEALAE